MPFHAPRGLKQDMKDGHCKVGMFAGTSSPQIAELAGLAGIDFLFADLEHGHSTDRASVSQLIRTADITRTPVMVRVPANNAEDIASVLDDGAIGICVPHVRTHADAERLVAYARYAPTGVRAMSPSVRAADYSAVGWDEYWRIANDEVITMAIVEDRVGMSNLDEIAAVPGLDALWIGTGDYSQDVGVPMQHTHPAVVDAKQKGLAAARRNGLTSFMAVGQSPTTDRAIRRAQFDDMYEQGYQMLAWMDWTAIKAAVAEIVAATKPGPLIDSQ
jgi:2-keto-3-deoxy-L-rhamnonate aldolase RhmA